MDRIKAKIYPEYISKNYDNEYDDNTYHNDKIINSKDLAGSSRSRFAMPWGQRNYTRPYTNYGNYSGIDDALLPQDNLSEQLSQMEYDTFGTEFPSDDTQTRVKRLNSAQKAKKTSQKYDSQKFSQHMSTAMEIGAMILMILAMVL